MQGHFTEVNGVVVFEAEEFANNLSPRSSHSWTFNTGLGSSGTGYMEATPESNASLSAGGTSPELQYDIVFNTAGTYYVWVSGWAQNNGSDTVHSGLDGSFANSDCIYNFTNGVWSWQQNHKSGCSGGASRATVNVAAGSRVFSLWMNEDSFRADRVLLVNDSAYTPNPPVITINATAVVSGQSTVSWSITNPSKKTCTASSNPSGLWSGSKASSGSETVSGITGNITLTLNCVGPLGESDSKSVTVGPFAFHLTNGGDASVNSGSLVTVPIHAVLDGGTAQNVTFSRTKPVTPPTGMTFSFSPASCLPISSPGCLSTLTVNTTASTPPGTYQVEITGTASSLTQTTTFNVTVNAFDFSLANSGNISVTQGAASGSNTITATLVSGTTQSVSFTVSGLPSGATYSIANCSPTCPTTLTINGLATAAVGTYSITVTGTGGGQTHPTTFTLNIVAVGSPVAAYGMNEASGNTTADASGNGNTGTLQNAPSRVASKSGYGNAISFNGTSQYVRVNDAATLDLGNSGTVMAWVKLNTLGVWNDIFSKGNGSNDRDFNYSIEIDNANHAYCNLGNGTSSLANPVISTATVAASVFTHVACVWNGTTVTIYINGTPNGSVAQTITPAGNATPLGIGVWGVVDYMHGVIDEARIYNVALTQAQIQAAMNTPL